jgi:two-component system response regulator FixJ
MLHESGPAFLKVVQKGAPACLITDFDMPEMNGLALLREMERTRIAMPAIMMTGHADIPLAVTAMKAGLVDFLEKPFDDRTLLDAVDSAVLRATRQHLPGTLQRISLPVALTPREQQVLSGLLDGLTNKMIARSLGISPRTVEIHRANLMVKAKAKNLLELLRLTTPPVARAESAD